jgi:hypothetical protein
LTARTFGAQLTVLPEVTVRGGKLGVELLRFGAVKSDWSAQATTCSSSGIASAGRPSARSDRATPKRANSRRNGVLGSRSRASSACGSQKLAHCWLAELPLLVLAEGHVGVSRGRRVGGCAVNSCS